MKILAVGGDPVGGNIALSGSEIEIAVADHAVQTVFELIFDVSVPQRVVVGLGPEIANVGGATELGGDQIIDFKLIGRLSDFVQQKYFPFQGNRN